MGYNTLLSSFAQFQIELIDIVSLPLCFGDTNLALVFSLQVRNVTSLDSTFIIIKILSSRIDLLLKSFFFIP